jgi:hypothetical protein
MSTVNAKKSVSCLFAAILSIFSSYIVAETGSYQIELIVFSQNWSNTEVFDQTSSQIEWPNSLTELSAYTKADQLTLTDSVSVLSKNSTYQPFFHSAWIQSVEENSPGAPVHIQSTDGKLNGFVQMQRNRTLQLTVDLEYSPGQTGLNSESFIYRLNEKRHFQFNDLQYFDHPKLGAITKISTISQ